MATGEGFGIRRANLADAEAIGFAVVHPAGEESGSHVGELRSLCVRPPVWGRGAGRMLMERALEELSLAGCREAVLWTEKRNTRPRRIYERAGWALDGAVRERDLLGCPIRESRYRVLLAGKRTPSRADAPRPARS